MNSLVIRSMMNLFNTQTLTFQSYYRKGTLHFISWLTRVGGAAQGLVLALAQSYKAVRCGLGEAVQSSPGVASHLGLYLHVMPRSPVCRGRGYYRLVLVIALLYLSPHHNYRGAVLTTETPRQTLPLSGLWAARHTSQK